MIQHRRGALGTGSRRHPGARIPRWPQARQQREEPEAGQHDAVAKLEVSAEQVDSCEAVRRRLERDPPLQVRERDAGAAVDAALERLAGGRRVSDGQPPAPNSGWTANRLQGRQARKS